MFNTKHYITLDGLNILRGFSSAFEQPLEGDICINDDGGRHFEIDGEINPCLNNQNGVHLYKYVAGTIIPRTTEEIQIDEDIINSRPLPKSEAELNAERLVLAEDAINMLISMSMI
jgi:hypothetical protein